MTQKNHNEQPVEYVSLEDNKKYYYTPEMALTAYLLCKNHELECVDTTAKKALFIIKRTSTTNKEIKDYWNFKGTVCPQSYHNQLRRLKNQLHNSR